MHAEGLQGGIMRIEHTHAQLHIAPMAGQRPQVQDAAHIHGAAVCAQPLRRGVDGCNGRLHSLKLLLTL
jgi:Cu/Zn superoxide dismutase